MAQTPLPTFSCASALALLLAAAPAPSVHAEVPVPPRSAEQWRQAAIADIDIGYRALLENHPGVFDPHNPGFSENLKRAREQGLARAAQVKDGAGYVAAVQVFNTRIHDGHAGMYGDLGDGNWPQERWPGFVATWRGNAMYVYGSESGAPAVGAQVLSCDGLSVEKLMAANVFAFRGLQDEAGEWWVRGRGLFVDYGNPFVVLPKRCQFRLNGKTTRQDLVWRAATAQSEKWMEESYNGDKLDVGMTEPRAKLFWVAMPSFQPDEKERDAYRAINAEIKAHRQRYLDSDAIVVDLRHNQGGSSDWSEEFAAALWGEDRVSRLSSHSEVWWRASPGNLAHAVKMAEDLTAEKQFDGAEEARQASAGLQAALAKGDKFFIDRRNVRAPSLRNTILNLPSDPPAFTKPVYVIVPGQCASACLDALDTFTRFPNTRLIGAPSSADSTYMEVRWEKLASGLGIVVIPVKVYMDRPRASGQVYLPSIYVRDLVWSTATFLKVVEADLARKERLSKP